MAKARLVGGHACCFHFPANDLQLLRCNEKLVRTEPGACHERHQERHRQWQDRKDCQKEWHTDSLQAINVGTRQATFAHQQ